MKLRLIEQACDCSLVCVRGGLKVRDRLTIWHSGAECLPPRPGTCKCLPLHRSYEEAPTDRASLTLIYLVRGGGEQYACCHD